MDHTEESVQWDMTGQDAQKTLDPIASRFDRRTAVRRGVALGAGLTGGAALLRTGFVAQEASPSADAAGSTTERTLAIAAAANAFLETLRDSEREAALFDWSNTDQKQRWSNFPEGLFERDGLMWGDLDDAAQDAWLALMQLTLSAGGYERVPAEWAADDVLASGDGDGSGPGGRQMAYGRQYFWVAIIGEPSETDPWQWQWGGHLADAQLHRRSSAIPTSTSSWALTKMADRSRRKACRRRT